MMIIAQSFTLNIPLSSVTRPLWVSAYLAIGLAQTTLPIMRVYHLYGRLSVHFERTKDTVVDFSEQQFSIVRLMPMCASKVYSSDDGGEELAHAITISHDLSRIILAEDKMR